MDSENKAGFLKNKKVLGIFASILIVIPIAVGLFAVVQKQRANNNPEVLASNQVNDILQNVGKLIDVPNETPTIATVSDISKLQGQEFFSKAQNGDKVIIFPKAQKAILYRPGTNKIIEVAFYNPPAASPAPASQNVSTPVPTSSVSLRDLQRQPTGTLNPSTSPVPTSGSVRISPVPSVTVRPTQGQ